MRPILMCLLALPLVVSITACTAPREKSVTRDKTAEILALSNAIVDLGQGVDPKEAQRAAKIAYDYTRELAIAYEITDAPLIHNAKVNRGEKPRGLCWHWAEDMEARLVRENFRTLELHRAIANAFNPILIDHSTAIISRKGDTMNQGVIVDPWRFGGVLFWSPTLKDDRYRWLPREEVFEQKRGYREEVEALEEAGKS